MEFKSTLQTLAKTTIIRLYRAVLIADWKNSVLDRDIKVTCIAVLQHTTLLIYLSNFTSLSNDYCEINTCMQFKQEAKLSLG